MLYKLKLKRPNAIKSSLMTEFMKNGVPFKLYTGKTIHTKNWSTSKQAVLSGEENYDIINKYLDNWKNETNRIIESFQADKIRLTKDSIQHQLDKAFKKDNIEKREDAYLLFNFFYKF